MPHHLLIADDSVTIQRVIKLTFADEDIDVVAVGDGSQALAAIDKSPPDIVLVDVEMPGCSGYDVARHVRSSPRLSHIPVVLLTGAFEPVDEARASAVGCDGVLAKPFEPQAVLARVRDLLSRPRPAVARPPVVPSIPSIPLSQQGAPEPAPVVPVPVAAVSSKRPQDLDAYFERLDQAFSDLATSPRPGPVPAPPLHPAARDLDALAASFAAVPDSGDLTGRPATSPAALSLAVSAEPMSEPEPEILPSPEPVAPVAAVPLVLPAARATEPQIPRSLRPGVQSLVDAFQDLVAQEQAVAAPTSSAVVAAAVLSSVPAGVGATLSAERDPVATLSDEAVDRIATRVIERLSATLADGETADLVSRIAERLVREEIDAIKRRV